ncbi:MAG TPA: MFS transporter [Candidatus Limnocylindria bacterium]|nr:MFS transporter [Candidatus Limnocylindria bacterium]
MPPSLTGQIAASATSFDRSIAVLGLLAFISQVGVSIMLPLLPLYAVAVGATPAEIGLMVGSFSVTATVGQLAAGFLASRVPARRQMPIGQAIYAAGNFLIATTSTALPLIAFRAMAGLGGGMTIISERLYIARVTASDRLAFVNGVVSAAGSTGSVVGPLLGAVLATQTLQAPFIVVGCTATIAGVAALLFLPSEHGREAPGSSVRVEALPESLPESVELMAPSEATSTEPTAEAHATRWSHAQPLLRLALWSVAFNAAYGGWITTFSAYATDDLGHRASDVALFFAPFGAGAILLGPFLARVADRTGRRRMVAFGTGLVLLNVVVLIAGLPLLAIFGSALLAGGGLAAAQSSWFAMLGVATDGGRRGRSFGVVSALSNLGVIAGTAVASMAWTLVGVREGLISSAAFLVLAAASLLLVPSDRRRS